LTSGNARTQGRGSAAQVHMDLCYAHLGLLQYEKPTWRDDAGESKAVRQDTSGDGRDAQLERRIVGSVREQETRRPRVRSNLGITSRRKKCGPEHLGGEIKSGSLSRLVENPSFFFFFNAPSPSQSLLFNLAMLSNPSSSSRIATRAKNANVHPGQHEVPKRKRRTKAQITEDKKKAAEKKQAQLEKREAGLQKIAELEAQLEAAEVNEATPRPNFRKVRPAKLHRRETMLQIEIEDTDESDAPPVAEESEGGRTVDEYQLPSETALTATETEEDQPPKKKPKDKKRSLRDAIRAYRVPLASMEGEAGEGVVRGQGDRDCGERPIDKSRDRERFV